MTTERFHDSVSVCIKGVTVRLEKRNILIFGGGKQTHHYQLAEDGVWRRDGYTQWGASDFWKDVTGGLWTTPPSEEVNKAMDSFMQKDLHLLHLPNLLNAAGTLVIKALTAALLPEAGTAVSVTQEVSHTWEAEKNNCFVTDGGCIGGHFMPDGPACVHDIQNDSPLKGRCWKRGDQKYGFTLKASKSFVFLFINFKERIVSLRGEEAGEETVWKAVNPTGLPCPLWFSEGVEYANSGVANIIMQKVLGGVSRDIGTRLDFLIFKASHGETPPPLAMAKFMASWWNRCGTLKHAHRVSDIETSRILGVVIDKEAGEVTCPGCGRQVKDCSGQYGACLTRNNKDQNTPVPNADWNRWRPNAKYLNGAVRIAGDVDVNREPSRLEWVKGKHDLTKPQPAILMVDDQSEPP